MSISIIPSSRPGAPAELIERILRYGTTTMSGQIVPGIPSIYPVCILNVRAYYRDSMGKPWVNDANVYDDAAFVLAPSGLYRFNANTDPSVVGWNNALGKPYAMLDEGIHFFIRGKHKGQYSALRQADPEQAAIFDIPNHGYFPVIRNDGKGSSYVDTGYHAINYHRGANLGTSSWGCQTIPPSQYDEFIKLVYSEMTRHKQRKIPVLLIDGPIN